MTIKTKTGLTTMDFSEFAAIEYKHELFDTDAQELLLISFKGGFMGPTLLMETKEAALTIMSLFEAHLLSDTANLSENTKEPRSYIDGFKAGCEYTLKLPNLPQECGRVQVDLLA